MTATGTGITMSFNNTGQSFANVAIAGSSVAVNFATPDNVASFTGTVTLTLTALGQKLIGSIGFIQQKLTDGQRIEQLSFNGVQFALGPTGTDPPAITAISGTAYLTPNGFVGSLNANVALNLNANISGSGTASLLVNTTNAPFQQTIAGVKIDLPAGPFVHAEADNLHLTVLGNTLVGNFFFEQIGASEFAIAVNGLSLALGNGTTNFLSVTNGQGYFDLTSAGLAGMFSASVTAGNVPGLALQGAIQVQINTTANLVSKTFEIGDTIRIK